MSSRLALCGLSLGMMLLLFSQPMLSMEYIRRGMSICVRTMIPSLFPFMVVSELIVRSGAGEALARLPARLTGWPAEGVCACLLGMLCGFPVGTRTAAEYYRRGRLTSRQFNVVLSLCNVPSSAFLVCAVGVSLFGSQTLGRGFLVLALIASLSTGLLWALLSPKNQAGKGTKAAGEGAVGTTEVTGAAQLLPEAISSAAVSMLGVCATVLLFCSLMGAITGLLDHFAVSESAKAGLVGLFELSGGVCAAALLPDANEALILCAAMIGWGGLSVHCQIFSVCKGCPVDLFAFWLGRAWQALVCGGGMLLWLRTYPPSLSDVPRSMAWRDLWEGRGAQTGGFSFVWTWACGVMLVVGLGVWCARRKRRKGDAGG